MGIKCFECKKKNPLKKKEFNKNWYIVFSFLIPFVLAHYIVKIDDALREE